MPTFLAGIGLLRCRAKLHVTICRPACRKSSGETVRDLKEERGRSRRPNLPYPSRAVTGASLSGRSIREASIISGMKQGMVP